MGVGEVNTGQNSGYQAIGLAYQFGAARILLTGFDMQHTAGRSHWHGDHPAGMGNAQNIHRWVRHFAALADDLRAVGVEVVNCTRETALECWPRSTLEAELCRQ
jgi:hypothetical protein